MKTKAAEAKKESGKSSPKTEKPGAKKKPVGLLKKLADAKEVRTAWGETVLCPRDFFPLVC